MDGNEIDAEGGIAVAHAMANKNNLKFLNLNCNQFGEPVFVIISRFLILRGTQISDIVDLGCHPSCSEGLICIPLVYVKQ